MSYEVMKLLDRLRELKAKVARGDGTSADAQEIVEIDLLLSNVYWYELM